MHILIDLAILLIIAGAVWVGYRKGFILGLCGILAIVISFYGANLVSNTYYEEFKPILEPIVGGLVDDAVQKTLDPNDQERDDQNDLFIYTGDTNSREGVYNVALMTLGRFGLAEAAAEKAATELASGEINSVGTEFRSTLTDQICSLITRVLAFTIVFLLFIIVFTVIANILNLQLRIPGFDMVNHIAGAGLGFLRAWFIVSLIAFVLRYAGALISGEMLRKTILLEFFMNNNIVAAILGL